MFGGFVEEGGGGWVRSAIAEIHEISLVDSEGGGGTPQKIHSQTFVFCLKLSSLFIRSLALRSKGGVKFGKI